MVTAWMLTAAACRHRLVLVWGALGTVLLVYWAGSGPGVFYQRVTVRFFAPIPTAKANVYQFTGQSLVSVASITKLRVEKTSPSPEPVSSSVTIVDEGVLDGSAIRMPNSGGQWAYSFQRPVLEVEASGPSADLVRARALDLAHRIQSQVAGDQADLGVPPAARITTALNPPFPPLLYQQGSRPRARGMAAMLGLGLTLSLVVAVDRWSMRWMMRPRPVRQTGGLPSARADDARAP
jgi:hypothetical protein